MDEVLVLKFALRSLRFFLKSFSDYFKTVVAMYYIDRKTQKDIAESLSFALPWVRSKLWKFRLHMKKTPEGRRLLQFFEAYRKVAADYTRSQKK